jgi:hypothetical protein
MLHPWIAFIVGGVLGVAWLEAPVLQEPLWIRGYLGRAPEGIPVVQTVELEQSGVRRSLAIVAIETTGTPRLRLADDVRDGTEIGVVGEPEVLRRLLEAPQGSSVRFRTRRAGPARTFHVDELTVTMPAEGRPGTPERPPLAAR